MFFKAEESTKRWAAGKQFSDLDGVPIAIKDQIDIEGLTVRNGLPFPENNPSTFDGAVIEKVKKAWGHIIIRQFLFKISTKVPQRTNIFWGIVLRITQTYAR